MDEEQDVERHGITLEEASRYLGVSTSTIRRIVERGEIPAARVGGPQKGRLILLRRDLDAYLTKQQQAFEESRTCDSEDTPLPK